MLTTETLARKIVSRIILLDGLIEKRDWEAVIETADELIMLEKEAARLEREARQAG